MRAIDLIGALDAASQGAPKRDVWIAAAATLAGGVAGALVWPKHRVLGLLNGFSLAGNTARLVTKEITPRRAAENVGAHIVATAGALALPRYPWIGYIAGAAGANAFIRRKEDTYVERLDETVLGGAVSFGAAAKRQEIIDAEIVSETHRVGGDEDYGPISPEQLAALDRKLTPAEQKAVDEWRIAQAARKAEEAKGGPKGGGLVLTARDEVLPARGRGDGLLFGRPAWKTVLVVALAILGGGAVLYALGAPVPRRVPVPP